MEELTLPNILRALAAVMETPVIIVLLLYVLVTCFMLGSLLVELVTERRRLKARLPELADRIRAGGNMEAIIQDSGLLKRQRSALLEIIAHPALSAAEREALAVRLITRERSRYDSLTFVTDVIARTGPMIGLLGTLIPLGPGLVALGVGDVAALSAHMLLAFDMTITGLLAAAVAFVVSGIRKRVYASYMASLEMVAECVLEELGGGGLLAASQPTAMSQPADASAKAFPRKAAREGS